MDITKAKTLRLGQTVNFPADRGSPAGSGRVYHVSRDVSRNPQGVEYIWVTVQWGDARHVWPSNRLGGTVAEVFGPRIASVNGEERR